VYTLSNAKHKSQFREDLDKVVTFREIVIMMSMLERDLVAYSEKRSV
jgi:hypothetical protein